MQRDNIGLKRSSNDTNKRTTYSKLHWNIYATFEMCIFGSYTERIQQKYFKNEISSTLVSYNRPVSNDKIHLCNNEFKQNIIMTLKLLNKELDCALKFSNFACTICQYTKNTYNI